MYAGFLDLKVPLVWTVDDLLSPEECAGFIDRMHRATDVHVAPITGVGGEVVVPGVRSNTRTMFDDPVLAELLWSRIRSDLPALLLGLQVVGVNERFRIYRYGEGQHHGSHMDSSIELPDGRKSLLTFMIYLNDVPQGGQTTFDEIGETVLPRAGRALLFQHRVVHIARPVLRGEKYALRSEIFYREPS